jgi:hypothetical protein
MNKKKKYGNGTKVNNYIENPYEELQEDSLNKANAIFEGESNPLTQFMSLAGNTLMQMGLDKGGTGNSLLDSSMILSNNLFGNGGNVTDPPPTQQELDAWKKQDFAKNTGNEINIGDFSLLTDPKDLESYWTEFLGTKDQVLEGRRVWRSNIDPTQAVMGDTVDPEFAKRFYGTGTTSNNEVEDSNPLFVQIPVKNQRGQLKYIYAPNTPDYNTYNKTNPMLETDWKNSEYYTINQSQPLSNYTNNPKAVGNKLGYFPFEKEPNLELDPTQTDYDSGAGDLWKNQWLIDYMSKKKGGNGLNIPKAGNGMKVPVNIEGDEVVETPEGNLFEVEGPSHEEGGINTALPGGTKVYSDRIKIKGVTMADRKTKRESKKNSLEKLLENNPSDALFKSSMTRVLDTNASQEQKDMQIQEVIDALMGGEPLPIKAFGGIINPNDNKNIPTVKNKTDYKGPSGFSNAYPPSYIGNTPLAPVDVINEAGSHGIELKNPNTRFALDAMDLDTRKEFMKTIIADSIKNQDFIDSEYNKILNYMYDVKGNGGKVYANGTPPEGIPSPEDWAKIWKESNTGIDPTMEMYNKFFNIDNIGSLNTKAAQTIPSSVPGEVIKNNISTNVPTNISTESKEQLDFPNLTGGDLTSLTGNLISTFGPYFNTLKNRATDTPNINAFENFGQDSLDKLSSMEEYISQVRDNKLLDNNLSKNAMLKSSRGGARGINQMRAMDLAIDSQSNKANRDIYDSFASQMLGLLGQQAQAKMSIDQVVMGGEQGRDLADRQDRDNFSTQLAQNISSMGYGLQETGKDLNDVKQREVINNLLNQLSSYGLEIDKDGNIIQG